MFRPLPFVLASLALAPAIAAHADDAAKPMIPLTPRVGTTLGSAAGYPETPTTAPPITMDDRSRDLLQRVARKIQGAQAISAEYEADGQNVSDKHVVTLLQTDHASLQVMRPGSLHLEREIHVEGLGHDGSKQISNASSIVNSDGKMLLTYWDPAKKLYDETPLSDDRGELERRLPPFFYGFFTSGVDGFSKNFNITTYYYAGTEQWQGRDYQIVDGNGIYPGLKITSPTHLKLWIGDDDLVHRATFQLEMHFPKTASTSTTDYVLNKVRVASRVDQKVFAYRPPADAKKISIRDYYSQMAAKPPMESGTVAPDFAVYDPSGKVVKLSDYKGKVVVIDFWATWCGPCQASLPDTNGAAHKFQDKDVVFLAINVWDKKDAFDQWLPQHKQLDALNFVIDTTPGQGQDVASKLYHVTGIPTQFVIGKDGKVAKCLVGNSGSSASLEAALQTAVAN